MRLLVAAPRFPWPLDKGDRLTVFRLLRYFAERHEVALVCFLEPGQQKDWVRHLPPNLARVELVPLGRAGAYGRTLAGLASSRPLQVHYYGARAMTRRLQEVAAGFRPDLIYAHTIRMAEHVTGLGVPSILAMQVSMALNYGRLARFASAPWRRAAYRLEARRARSYEPGAARRFDRCLLISDADVGALGSPRPANLVVNPHGVDFEYFRPSGGQAEAGRIIFTGNMAYPPNLDAAVWFAAEILPLVHLEVPEARLAVVGADPPPALRRLAADPTIEVTGRVPDLRPYLERAVVGIDPLRVGAGLQNKVLEGMAMGLPMVITSIANEGIGAVDGEEVVVADDPAAFAAAVVALLRDPDRCRALGRRARAAVERGWSWEGHFADLEAVMAELVAGGGGSAPDRPGPSIS